MNFSGMENKMAGLEDLEFFPTLLGWDSLVDEGPVTTICSSVKNFTEDGAIVDNILEEIEIDNGYGLDIDSEWLTGRVDLSGFELGLSELTEFGLENDWSTFETIGNDLTTLETQVDIPLITDTVETLSGTPCLANEPSSPLSPEQCVPELTCFTSISSPSHSSLPSPCGSSGVEIVSSVESSPPHSNAFSCDTKIGAIMSDSAKVAKTIQVKEKDSASNKHHKVQPKVKTVTQRKRKQVQNRDAATRYRIKKKEEYDVLFKKAEELEKENAELNRTVGSLTQEIEYLRKLMVEVYKARLLKSFPAV